MLGSRDAPAIRTLMVEPEALQAAAFAACGEVEALVNQLGLAARGAPTAKLVSEVDLRAALRRSLQFGRVEHVATGLPLGRDGVLAEPFDVVVQGRRVPQLALEIRWHPRGEDHEGFARRAARGLARLGLARAREAVEQTALLVAAPSRFWRWLPAYAADRPGFALIDPDPESPATVRVDAAGFAFLREDGVPELPERLWAGLLLAADVRSPWAEAEVRLVEVKGLGAVGPAPAG